MSFTHLAMVCSFGVGPLAQDNCRVFWSCRDLMIGVHCDKLPGQQGARFILNRWPVWIQLLEKMEVPSSHYRKSMVANDELRFFPDQVFSTLAAFHIMCHMHRHQPAQRGRITLWMKAAIYLIITKEFSIDLPEMDIEVEITGSMVSSALPPTAPWWLRSALPPGAAAGVSA